MPPLQRDREYITCLSQVPLTLAREKLVGSNNTVELQTQALIGVDM